MGEFFINIKGKCKLMNMTFVLIAGIVIGVLVIGYISMAALYKSNRKGQAFVRNGVGGEKVVTTGGCLVLPTPLHKVTPVNLETFQFEITLEKEDAIITSDNLRVDLSAIFYMRVGSDVQAISTAAQSLGDKTLNPNLVKELINSKLVDVLRSCVANRTLNDLHLNRNQFSIDVQKEIEKDLSENGLKLESISIPRLDQTEIQYFKEDNMFDAKGLTIITEVKEKNRDRRNEITRATEVNIAKRDLDAEKEKIAIQKDEEQARINQQRELAEIKAAQDKLSQEAEIAANAEIQKKRIDTQREIDEREIKRKQSVELARQESNIEINKKSEQESKAKADADKAKVLAIQEEENVITVKEVAIAERQKQIELVEASKKAEQEAIKLKVEAEAQKVAAEDKAKAQEIEAQGEANAIILKAQALEKQYEVEAEGKRKQVEAMNVMSGEQIELQKYEKLVASLPQILQQAVQPLNNIDSIKLVGGFGAQGVAGLGGSNYGKGETGLPEQVVNASLNHLVGKSYLQELLKGIGINDLTVNGFLDSIKVNGNVVGDNHNVETNVGNSTNCEQTKPYVDKGVKPNSKA